MRILDLIEHEEKEDRAGWLQGLYVQTIGTYAGLVDHKGLPPTRQEQKEAEKITDKAIIDSREPTEEFLNQFRRGLRSVRHFGEFIGRTDILGEPPPDELKSAERLRHERESVLEAASNIWG